MTRPRSGAPVPPQPLGWETAIQKWLSTYAGRQRGSIYYMTHEDDMTLFQLILASNYHQIYFLETHLSNQMFIFFSSKYCLSIQLILILHVFITCFIQNRKYQRSLFRPVQVKFMKHLYLIHNLHMKLFNKRPWQPLRLGLADNPQLY